MADPLPISGIPAGPLNKPKTMRKAQSVEEVYLRMTADLKLRVDLARVSLIHFYHLVWTTEVGDPVSIEWFHHEWATELSNEAQFEVFIEGARETTKTTMLMAAVVWAIGRNPNLRVLWVSESGPAAEKRIATMAKYITDSEMLHLVFPNLKLCSKNDRRKNNQETINVERPVESQDDTVRGVGVLSPGTGSRSDILVLDDAVGYTNAIQNPANRPRVQQKILNDWIGTLDRVRGRLWAAFNPWADDDAMSYLKKRTAGFYKVYAHGIKGDPYYSFCPKLWSRENLIRRRRLVGEMTYLRGYCCITRPRGKKDVIVHPDHLRYYDGSLLTPELLPYLTVTISADPASGRSAEDKEHQGTLDYNGVTILISLLRDDLLIDPTGDNHPSNHRVPLPPKLRELFDHLYQVILIVDTFRFRSSQEEQARILWNLAAAWQASAILAESVGLSALETILQLTKGSLPPSIQALVQATEIFAIPVGNRSKGDRLLTTTPYINPPPGTPPAVYFHPASLPFEPDEVEHGTITLLSGETLEVERPLRAEMLDFPQKHDDALDSYTQGVNHLMGQNPPFIDADEDGANPQNSGMSSSFLDLG